MYAKKKLSHNRPETEKDKIIEPLKRSNNSSEQAIADFMRNEP
jgi:predicted FMN-binding regulatory protein PaiB